MLPGSSGKSEKHGSRDRERDKDKVEAEARAEEKARGSRQGGNMQAVPPQARDGRDTARAGKTGIPDHSTTSGRVGNHEK